MGACAAVSPHSSDAILSHRLPSPMAAMDMSFSSPQSALFPTAPASPRASEGGR